MSEIDSMKSSDKKTASLTSLGRSICSLPVRRYRDLVVTAKFASSWGLTELNHFGVFFKYVSFEEFFRQAAEPLGEEWQVWLTADEVQDAVVEGNEKVWNVLEKVQELHDPLRSPQLAIIRESLTEQLVMDLFRLFRYISAGKSTARTLFPTSFMMCGEECDAVLDQAVIRPYRNYIVLVFQEDVCPKKPSGSGYVKAQIVAQAIATFTHNNLMRQSRRRLPLREALIPLISMCGSTPTFYLAPITQKLVDHVAAGTSPNPETVLIAYEPIPEYTVTSYSQGLFKPSNRLAVTQAYLTFKKFFLNQLGDLEGSSPFRIDEDLHSLKDGDEIF